jgi:hypothetical protein
MIETLLITMALTAAYAIGKGIGRAQGRQQALHITLKINGDTIGGFGIVGYEIGVPTRDTDT